MRHPFSISGLAVLVLCALAAAALSSGLASASGDEPTILLDTKNTCTGSFGASADPPPTAIYLGYGAFTSRTLEPIAVVFDQDPIQPSTQTQVFVDYVSDDPDAAALANILSTLAPPNSIFGVGTWFPNESGHGVGSCGHALLQVPPGSHIQYFKLTLSPFSIDKVTENDPLGRPSSSYRAAPIIAVVEAWGPPPPGDANCDATINSLDALVMLQHSAGLLDTLSCAKAADVNADGTVDARDAQLVLQFSAGLLQAL